MIVRDLENTRSTIQKILDTMKLLLGSSGEIDISIRPSAGRDPRIKLTLGQFEKFGQVIPYGAILGAEANMKYDFAGDEFIITFGNPQPVGFGGPIEARIPEIRVSLDEIYTILQGIAPDIKMRVVS